MDAPPRRPLQHWRGFQWKTDNHFIGENFGFVSATDWSQRVTGSLAGGGGTLSSVLNAFDGSTLTRFSSSVDGTNVQIDFNPPLSVSSTVEVFSGSDTQVRLTSNEFGQEDITTGGSNQYVTYSGAKTVTSIRSSAIYGSSRGAIFQIVVDGVTLVDRTKGSTTTDSPIGYINSAGEAVGNYCIMDPNNSLPLPPKVATCV